jgi:hypothetical protein
MSYQLKNELAQRAMPAENDWTSLSSDLLRGVGPIAAEIGQSIRQTYYQLEGGKLPAGNRRAHGLRRGAACASTSRRSSRARSSREGQQNLFFFWTNPQAIRTARLTITTALSVDRMVAPSGRPRAPSKSPAQKRLARVPLSAASTSKCHGGSSSPAPCCSKWAPNVG